MFKDRRSDRWKVVLTDALVWLLIFFLMGVPLKRDESVFYTVLFAVAVSASWPCSLLTCADIIHRSVAGECTQDELGTTPLQKPLSIDELVVGTQCMILAALLLLSGSFSQLDWQWDYEKWPYPAIGLYTMGRLALLLLNNRLYSVLQ